jgi:hypothetical protein
MSMNFRFEFLCTKAFGSSQKFFKLKKQNLRNTSRDGGVARMKMLKSENQPPELAFV